MNNTISLLDEINRIGKQKIRFFVPMFPVHSIIGFCSYTCFTDPEYLTECFIDEERYKVEEGYKITLKSINHMFGYKHFYQCDLESLINQKKVYIAEDSEIIEQFWYDEPIGGGFMLKSFATAIIKNK